MSIKQKKDPSEEGKRQLEALRQAVGKIAVINIEKS